MYVAFSPSLLASLVSDLSRYSTSNTGLQWAASDLNHVFIVFLLDLEKGALPVVVARGQWLPQRWCKLWQHLPSFDRNQYGKQSFVLFTLTWEQALLQKRSTEAYTGRWPKSILHFLAYSLFHEHFSHAILSSTSWLHREQTYGGGRTEKKKTVVCYLKNLSVESCLL